MPQLSLYLDDTTMDVLRRSAEKEGVSLSHYARRLIQDQASSAWPVSFWGTYGSVKDDSFVAPEELDPELDGELVSFD
ncbi:putative uncharacterized protein [Eggerthella sp. CAG:368]|nr:putative uncharacterized protein [Eggerthella sp. CAG:368]